MTVQYIECRWVVYSIKVIDSIKRKRILLIKILWKTFRE